jgi:hypothetical protein
LRGNLQGLGLGFGSGSDKCDKRGDVRGLQGDKCEVGLRPAKAGKLPLFYSCNFSNHFGLVKILVEILVELTGLRGLQDLRGDLQGDKYLFYISIFHKAIKFAVQYVFDFGYNLNLLILRGQLHERFGDSLGAIRAVLTELGSFEILIKYNMIGCILYSLNSFGLLNLRVLLDQLSRLIDRLHEHQNSYNFNKEQDLLDHFSRPMDGLFFSHFSHLKVQIYKHVLYNVINLDVENIGLQGDHLIRAMLAGMDTFQIFRDCNELSLGSGPG